MTAPVHFFCLASEDWQGAVRLEQAREASAAFTVNWWRPAWRQPFPPGRADPRVMAYTPMMAAGMFASRDYAMVMLRAGDGKIAHSSLVMPAFARFPFMAPGDVQIGATQTDPAFRGRGLAVRAIDEVVAAMHRPGRRFWYLTDDSNQPSIAVIRKAGFSLAGHGSKLPRLGARALGYYAITEPANGH